MKRFMMTTATALTLGGMAQADTMNPVFSDQQFNPETNLNASELVGMRVYASEASIENEMRVSGDMQTEWEDIGEINEILLTRDGQVQSLIVGVGGFLGIGEKDVSVNMSEVRFVTEDGADRDDFFLVIEATAVGVQDAPSYDYNLVTNTMGGDADIEMDDNMRIANDRMAQGLEPVMANQLTTEDLTGMTVLGRNDESVGEIGELLLTADGKLDRAIIDVGGFLGMGEKPVAVDMDELTIMRAADGGDLRVFMDATEETLEAKPEYRG